MMHAAPQRAASFPVTRRSVSPDWLMARPAVQVHPVFGAVEPEPEPTDLESEVQLDPRTLEQLVTDQVETRLSELRTTAEDQGREAGRAAGRQELEQKLGRVGQLLDELDGLRLRLMGATEEQMVDLALCVAQAILERELVEDRQYALDRVRQAVGMVASDDVIEIRVAPADHQLVSDGLASVTRDTPRSGSLVLRADPSVQSGCIVETRLARVDATLAARLHSVSQALHRSPDSDSSALPDGGAA